MAARSSSSRLVSQLLRKSNYKSAASLPTLTSRPPILRVERCIFPSSSVRYISSSPIRYEQSVNTAPSPPSQTSSNASPSPDHRKYTFAEIQKIISAPPPNWLLIDVREPQELKDSGKIPTALNLPLKTSPDFMFLKEDEFEDRFGRPRPGPDDEVVFYCRSGVRSKAAAELAKRAEFGGTVSEFPGSWLEWEKNGGEIER